MRAEAYGFWKQLDEESLNVLYRYTFLAKIVETEVRLNAIDSK
jgi:hypothetical protein